MKDVVLNIEQTVEHTADWPVITMKAHPSGLVYWCSHWEYIDRLAALGVFARVEKGPMHHRDYYLKV